MVNKEPARLLRKYGLPNELLGIILLVIPGMLWGADELPTMFYHDFRGKPTPTEWTRFNVKEEGLLYEEPEELRINLPPTFKHDWGGVGLVSSFGLTGDFEITASFEILKAEIPPFGFGVGVGLFVDRAGVNSGVCRLVREGGNPMVLWEVNDNGKVKSGNIPNNDMVGRLRITRAGKTLHFLWAPGLEGNAFQDVHETEYSTDDIKKIRLTVLNGRTKTPVEARFLDLRIRNGAPLPAPSLAARGGVSLALVVGLAFTMGLIIVLSTWVYVRGRRAKDSSQVEPVPEATPDAEAGPIIFPCPGCAKKLKTKAEFTGKKIKCPQCGQAVVVPEIVV